MSIGDNIKKIRKANKLTQKQFAEVINKKNYRTIQKYENGDIIPPISVINDISEKFDIPVVEIIGDDPRSDINGKFVISEIDKSDNFDIGLNNALDKLHKKPSYIRKEKQANKELYSILNDFDKFASNIYIENNIGYKFNELSILEQDELFNFMYDMLRMKILEIHSRDNK